MAEPPPPEEPRDLLAPARELGFNGLLELLVRLDGAAEAEVVQAALAGGISPVVVLEELRREVERRLMRAHGFYDRSGP